MPLSDPYSSYLDRLARQRAEDELMRSRLGEASEQFGKGLGQWNEALRIQKADTRQAEQDTAKTAQTAFENEQTVEGLRLRKAQDARDAAAHDVALAAAKAKVAAEPTFADKAADAFTLVRPEEREPGEIVPEDVEGTALSPEASNILLRLRKSTEPGAAPMEQALVDKMDAARLRKMEADAAIAERKAKGGGGTLGVTSKKEIDRQLAVMRLKAAEAKAAGGQLPTVSDARAVTEIDAALTELSKISRDASKIDTGPIADAQSVAKSLVGLPDADVVKFKSRVGEQLAQYIKGISGATVAKEERARLLENVPTFQDNDVEFDAKLERVIETLNVWRQREINAMKAAGKRTEQFGVAPSAAPVADPQAAFLKTATDLAKQLGRKPTREELQNAMRAAGVLE